MEMVYEATRRIFVLYVCNFLSFFIKTFIFCIEFTIFANVMDSSWYEIH